MLLQIVAIMLSLSFCCLIVGVQVFELFPSSVMLPHCRYGGQSSVPTFGYDITLPCNICSISTFNHAATTLLPCMFLFCFYAGSCAVILLPIFFFFTFFCCFGDICFHHYFCRHSVAIPFSIVFARQCCQGVLSSPCCCHRSVFTIYFASHCIDVSITAFVRFSSAILLYSSNVAPRVIIAICYIQVASTQCTNCALCL